MDSARLVLNSARLIETHLNVWCRVSYTIVVYMTSYPVGRTHYSLAWFQIFAMSFSYSVSSAHYHSGEKSHDTRFPSQIFLLLQSSQSMLIGGNEWDKWLMQFTISILCRLWCQTSQSSELVWETFDIISAQIWVGIMLCILSPLIHIYCLLSLSVDHVFFNPGLSSDDDWSVSLHLQLFHLIMLIWKVLSFFSEKRNTLDVLFVAVYQYIYFVVICMISDLCCMYQKVKLVLEFFMILQDWEVNITVQILLSQGWDSNRASEWGPAMMSQNNQR